MRTLVVFLLGAATLLVFIMGLELVRLGIRRANESRKAKKRLAQARGPRGRSAPSAAQHRPATRGGRPGTDDPADGTDHDAGRAPDRDLDGRRPPRTAERPRTDPAPRAGRTERRRRPHADRHRLGTAGRHRPGPGVGRCSVTVRPSTGPLALRPGRSPRHRRPRSRPGRHRCGRPSVRPPRTRPRPLRAPRRRPARRGRRRTAPGAGRRRRRPSAATTSATVDQHARGTDDREDRGASPRGGAAHPGSFAATASASTVDPGRNRNRPPGPRTSLLTRTTTARRPRGR